MLRRLLAGCARGIVHCLEWHMHTFTRHISLVAGGTQGKMFFPPPQPLVTSTEKHTIAINVGMFMRRLTSRL